MQHVQLCIFLLISTFLRILMVSVNSSGGCRTIAWSIGIKNFDIKESFLTPETIYRNVQTSTIINIGGSQRKMLTSNRLEMRFNLYFMANLSQKISSEVMDLIVSNRRKAPFSIGKRMLNCILCTTWTMKGNPSRVPTISKSNGIMETSLSKAMLLPRKDSEPT